MRQVSAMSDSLRTRVGRTIRNARLHMSYSQKDVASALHVEPYTVANWESGRSLPDMMLLPALCDFLYLPISAFFQVQSWPSSLSEEEQRAVLLYRRLSRHDRGVAHAMVSALSSTQEDRLRRHCLNEFVPLCWDQDACRSGKTAPLYHPEDGNSVFVRRSALSDNPDEIICVSDSAMAPALHEGSLAFLRYADRIREGETGVFRIDGTVLIRQYQGDHLHALSPDFPDIPIREDQDMLFFGRITGPVDPSVFPNREEEEMLRRISRTRAAYKGAYTGL